ncbi:DUF2750 domain-containing protein [Pseudoalteromonas sp. JBTF-M23]|uniref:DUF2750 domain-containing protein n=1 Tax=Pseudoalteromonas caenipelagi TaxID=2726988 RepID=A0A849VG95_9GAMM|nr:DUF2750 domain-containing protein [Pseudoalteromonas caenipelagi]NOU51533.1 DUF2750 domain-containing protein [Pseudoalteromonas caenipelagi]
MDTPINPDRIKALLHNDNEQRYKYLIKEVTKNELIWILTDEHGCVMLNTDSEDCVPIWPNKEFAQLWATGDWQDCQPLSISLKKWHAKWTDGLADDELAIAVFPVPEQDGLIVYPDELDYELVQYRSRKP